MVVVRFVSIVFYLLSLFFYEFLYFGDKGSVRGWCIFLFFFIYGCFLEGLLRVREEGEMEGVGYSFGE